MTFTVYSLLGETKNRNGMSIDSGIDLEKLVDAGDYICKELGKKSGSKFAQAFQKSCS